MCWALHISPTHFTGIPRFATSFTKHCKERTCCPCPTKNPNKWIHLDHRDAHLRKHWMNIYIWIPWNTQNDEHQMTLFDMFNEPYPNLILLYQRADPSSPQCRNSSQESVILRFDSNSSLLNLNWVGDRDKYHGHSRTGSNCNKIIQNLSHHKCHLKSLVSSCFGH